MNDDAKFADLCKLKYEQQAVWWYLLDVDLLCILPLTQTPGSWMVSGRNSRATLNASGKSLVTLKNLTRWDLVSRRLVVREPLFSSFPSFFSLPPYAICQSFWSIFFLYNVWFLVFNTFLLRFRALHAPTTHTHKHKFYAEKKGADGNELDQFWSAKFIEDMDRWAVLLLLARSALATACTAASTARRRESCKNKHGERCWLAPRAAELLSLTNRNYHSAITALERKGALKEIDQDNNGKMALIEYMLWYVQYMLVSRFSFSRDTLQEVQESCRRCCQRRARRR